MLHAITFRKMSPSPPAIPTAAAPMARFWGEIIFPRTPPELFEAAMSVGERSALWAAATCRAPNSEFDEVSDPVTATPNQPRIGERKAKKPPAPASHWPIVIVWPERVMTEEIASTDATVRVAQRRRTTRRAPARTARAGVILRIGIVMRPDSSSSVPAELAQLNLK